MSRAVGFGVPTAECRLRRRMRRRAVLQVLNTLLLATALHSRDVGTLAAIRYETAVLDPPATRAELARLVPEALGFTSPEPAVPAAADDTFATTTRKTELTACLTAADAEKVGTAAAGALSAGRDASSGPAWDLARGWASGDCLYSLAPPDSASRPKRRHVPAVVGRSCPVRWVPGRAPGNLRGDTPTALIWRISRRRDQARPRLP